MKPVAYSTLTPHERWQTRDAYVVAQEGKCYHCKSALSGQPASEVASQAVTPRLYPDTFFKFPVHLHHDHETGLTIGAVHSHCNAVLWEYHGE